MARHGATAPAATTSSTATAAAAAAAAAASKAAAEAAARERRLDLICDALVYSRFLTPAAPGFMFFPRAETAVRPPLMRLFLWFHTAGFFALFYCACILFDFERKMAPPGSMYHDMAVFLKLPAANGIELQCVALQEWSSTAFWMTISLLAICAALSDPVFKSDLSALLLMICLFTAALCLTGWYVWSRHAHVAH